VNTLVTLLILVQIAAALVSIMWEVKMLEWKMVSMSKSKMVVMLPCFTTSHIRMKDFGMHIPAKVINGMRIQGCIFLVMVE